MLQTSCYLYLVKPNLSYIDPREEVGKIVTHRFLISCEPKPSIIIDTKKQKIIVKVPDAPEKDDIISLYAVPEEENQCIQKVFYDKKNQGKWDRWGRDVAQIGAEFLGNVINPL